MTENDKDSIRVAVAVRVARVALGMSQQELAERIGIAKITLARVETLESKLKAEYYMRALRLFNQMGVEIDSLLSDNIKININEQALTQAFNKLQDESTRRKDRKKSKKDADSA